MIEARFIAFFFIFIIINFVVIGVVNIDLREKKFLSILGCMLSLMLIACVCFFPFPYQDELIESMISDNQGVTNNFIPFRTIFLLLKDAITYHLYGIILYQILGNIVLFMPLGYSLFYYLKEEKKFLRMLCCIILTTLFVEVEQGLFNTMMQVNYRSVDIDDIILNVFGGILGFCFAAFVIPMLKTVFNKRKKKVLGD